MFSLFKNDKPPYAVEKIAKGQLLDKAIEQPLDFFFERWIQKKPRKAMVGCWFVLHEDQQFVYWGKPSFKRMFSDKRIVEEFYKTNKAVLNEHFPKYKTVFGNAVRIKLQQYIQDAQQEDAYVTVSLGFKAQLVDSTMILETIANIRPMKSIEDNSHQHYKAIYKVVLDKNTLELIHLKKID